MTTLRTAAGFTAASALIISAALAWPSSGPADAEPQLSNAPIILPVALPELTTWSAQCVVNPSVVLADGTVGLVQLYGSASGQTSGLIETHFSQVDGLAGEDEVTGALVMELAGISVSVRPANGPNWGSVTSETDLLVEVDSISAR